MAAQFADQSQVHMHALRLPSFLQSIFIFNDNNCFHPFKKHMENKAKGSSSLFILGLISAMCKHNVGTRTAVLCIPMGHKATEKSPLRNTGQKNNPRPSTRAAYHLSPLAAQETCQNRGQRTKQGLFQVRSCDRPSGCFVEAQIPVAPSLNAFCTYEKQTNTHPCLQGRYLEHLQRGLLPSHTGFHLAAPAATYPLPPGHGGAPALRTALSAPAR